MKYLTHLLLVAVILSASACNKNSISPKLKTDVNLPGKWKVAGNMISSGGPMISSGGPMYFVPADSKDYVNFNTNGSMNGSAFPGFIFYAIKDTLKISMAKADMMTHEDYYYKIKSDSLTLSPVGPPFCIEGCAIVLVKE